MGKGTERPRLYATERESLVRLAMTVEVTRDMPETFRRRRKLVKGLPARLGLLKWLTSRVMDDLMDTVPAEQLMALRRNLAGASFVIGVRRPGSKAQPLHDDYGMWMSYNQLDTILEACKDHCMMCGLEPDTARQCPLKKAFDAMGVDIEHDGSCAYKEALIVGVERGGKS